LDEVHIRTRRDHASEIAEDYVEAIAEFVAVKGSCRSVDLAECFAVTPATVNNTVARLVRNGLVITAPYQPIGLTSKGRKLALKCKERHEVVNAFLIAIGVDAGTAAADSEGIEHHISKTTLAAMKKILADGWPAISIAIEKQNE
jgi:DtxR family manganese transport transcriptional regulator